MVVTSEMQEHLPWAILRAQIEVKTRDARGEARSLRVLQTQARFRAWYTSRSQKKGGSDLLQCRQKQGNEGMDKAQTQKNGTVDCSTGSVNHRWRMNEKATSRSPIAAPTSSPSLHFVPPSPADHTAPILGIEKYPPLNREPTPASDLFLPPSMIRMPNFEVSYPRFDDRNLALSRAGLRSREQDVVHLGKAIEDGIRWCEDYTGQRRFHANPSCALEGTLRLANDRSSQTPPPVPPNGDAYRERLFSWFSPRMDGTQATSETSTSSGAWMERPIQGSIEENGWARKLEEGEEKRGAEGKGWIGRQRSFLWVLGIHSRSSFSGWSPVYLIGLCWGWGPGSTTSVSYTTGGAMGWGRRLSRRPPIGLTRYAGARRGCRQNSPGLEEVE
ncbi:hypothetical protein FA13DRAFT_1774285 [Coprinellus micaceus]|uniref:Uncharacterized protein n=1 Tax=Coprinellus micaceus TaxID=71717 RepID=A0A4Y7TB87_COPMI|nr:hypothetical protein FA13DRAFT_1774285 [Coprinellus micaceus]